MSADGWFDHVFVEGNYLWTPPPVVAQVAVEQLCRNYHLREKRLHVVCIPCLMTYMRRKQLSKVTYLLLTLTFDETVWSQGNHEKLVIVLPFIAQRPWKLQGTDFLVGYERSLQEVWDKEKNLGVDYLRELLVTARSLGELPGNVVRRLLLSGVRRKLSPN